MSSQTFPDAARALVIGSGPSGIVRVGLDPGSVLWDQTTDSCGNLLVLEASFFCGSDAGVIVEHDVETGLPGRVFDAQNSNSGSAPTMGATARSTVAHDRS